MPSEAGAAGTPQREAGRERLDGLGQVGRQRARSGAGTWVTSYQCAVCGHVFDPAVGDPDTGIPPGTRFEDLPDSWTCPVCGSSKADFEPVGG
ncbi:rubredoxin [Streptomyces sp. NPDC090741]|uniref:rubredoxin n=1 Tax=Streptomyces sp. NPDC090741 TaxID=3365967 RepID=UPI00382286CA